jgi:hypothetical protein
VERRSTQTDIRKAKSAKALLKRLGLPVSFYTRRFGKVNRCRSNHEVKQ